MTRYKDVDPDRLHPNEGIKARSRFLRGTIEAGLADPITGAIDESDTQVTKFHGIYQQDDRDLRDERRRQKLEPAYQFMARVRLPGGVATPDQWLALDALAQHYAGNTLRLTTRQTFQFHWVLKRDLKTTIAGVNAALMDTIAACGDVNRNVLATNNPEQSRLHAEAYGWAKALSEHLLPRTRAFFELWLDGDRVVTGPDDDSPEEEPLYGPTYLPRKFKAAVAVPPCNDVDIFANDLGFIAIVGEDGALAGFNVTVGGGLGMTHGETQTYPRLADTLGYCTPDQLLTVAEAVVATQRDWGNREDRKQARLKYTIDTYGLEWFRAAVESYCGFSLAPPKPVHFTDSGDRYGWVQGADGRWYYTVYVENGRIIDRADYPLMTGLREIARVHRGDFRVTANQNVIIAGIEPDARQTIETLIRDYRLDMGDSVTALKRASMACVALPTCAMAMAEAERYLPGLLDKIHGVMAEAGLSDTSIKVRMTGCPNGCARPYLGEIGFVGKAPGKYNLYLGAGWHGQRLNKLYRENIGEDEILKSLGPIIHHYAADRLADEPFGDFCIRAGYITEVIDARSDFHA